MKGVPNQERLQQLLQDERDKFVSGKAQDLLLAYKLCFATEHGRMVLADLENSYGGISFTPGYPDVGAFKEGRRSVKDDIMNIMKLAVALQLAPPEPKDRR